MKKILLVLAIFMTTQVVEAQTGFVITDTVNTVYDIETDSVYMAPTFHTGAVVDSTCQVDLFVWNSESAKDSGASRIILKDGNGNLIDHITIIWYITDDYITSINKAKAVLVALYGWTIE